MPSAAERLEEPSARTSPVDSTHFCLAPANAPLQFADLLPTFASDFPGYVGGRFFRVWLPFAFRIFKHKGRVVADVFHQFLH